MGGHRSSGLKALRNGGYLLSTCYLPGAVLGAACPVGNQTCRGPTSLELIFRQGMPALSVTHLQSVTSAVQNGSCSDSVIG